MTVLETTDPASAGPVLVRRDGPAARITLNRPAQRNALSLALMGEAIAALDELGADAGVRAIVIEGAGPAFCAGHDLGEMTGRDVGFYQHVFDVCTQMMEALHRVPQPVIARAHGIATAAPWPRHPRRVPARRLVRPRGRRRGRALRDARREDRPVLLDADGPAVAGGRAQ